MTRSSTNLTNAGFELERGHHEVGTGGQQEINYKFNTLLAAADDLQLFKYIVKNTCWQYGKSATFMPKPLFGDNGSGMHVHQSLWKDGKPLFPRRGRLRGPVGHRSLVHRRHPAPRAVAAGVHQPDDQLVPPSGAGLRGPHHLVYSQRNRSAAVRIPITQQPEGQAHRVPRPGLRQPVPELRRADDGRLDGIKNKIEPMAPVDRTSTSSRRRRPATFRRRPPACRPSSTASSRITTTSPSAAFPTELIETWIAIKREQEIAPVNLPSRTRTSSRCTTTAESYEPLTPSRR